ncbi:MAG: His-Xaa-Ser system radical SAM maturase HxsB [Elusimicrobiota bacterium]|nr:His-Xaa-Ser system radical SAM maturase HxsB [Elusimicrobiota bacterium]
MKKEIYRPFINYFQKTKSGYFLSNDAGYNIDLTKKQFESFLKGKLKDKECQKKLSQKNFFTNRLDFDTLVERLGVSFLKDWMGPRIHIISVTKRCDSNCFYCGASASPIKNLNHDMSLAAAKKTVDFIFNIQTQDLMIEFQGGEPLLNFKTVKFIVNYVKKKNKVFKRSIHFSIVTNLINMDEKKLDFLIKNKVTVCSSLDGHKALHDLNRRIAKGSAHKITAKWLKKISALAKKNIIEAPNAICTISRASLEYPNRIVDEFLKLGLNRVQLGPMDPLGRAALNWKEVGYGAKEFLDFYKKALNHIMALNKKGIDVYEKGALMFARQILTGERPRYQNLDFIYRLAYNYNGNIYGSDEARMLSNSGDEFFKLGNVYRNSFKTLCNKPLSRTLFLAAFGFLTQPKCARCVYNPYCHMMPVYNYAAQGSFWGNIASSERCKIYKGVFDIIIDKMKDKTAKKILINWIEKHH